MQTHTHQGHHAGSISQAQLLEMSRVANPQFGIGFGYNSDYVQPDEFERFYNSLPSIEKEGMKNPSKTVSLVARASRKGSDDANLKLSQRRGQAVAVRLRKLPGFQARIEIQAVGESQSVGPNGLDNHTDRTVFVVVQPDVTIKRDDKPDAKWASRSVLDLRDKPAKDQAAMQQMGILFDVCVKPLQSVYTKVTEKPFSIRNVKDLIPNYNPLKMARDFATREAKWMGVQIKADLADRDIVGRINASTPWGLINGLEATYHVTPTSFQKNTLEFSPVYYMAGVDMAAKVYAGMSDNERDNLKLVLADRRASQEFRQQVLQGCLDWVSRGAVQTNRDFKTSLDKVDKFLEKRGM